MHLLPTCSRPRRICPWMDECFSQIRWMRHCTPSRVQRSPYVPWGCIHWQCNYSSQQQQQQQYCLQRTTGQPFPPLRQWDCPRKGQRSQRRRQLGLGFSQSTCLPLAPQSAHFDSLGQNSGPVFTLFILFPFRGRVLAFSVFEARL